MTESQSKISEQYQNILSELNTERKENSLEKVFTK